MLSDIQKPSRFFPPANFCTQRCLRGLQQGGMLDSQCPNVELHRQVRDSDRHLISSKRLMQPLKQQRDEDLDHNCTPFGACGAYNAPFKIYFHDAGDIRHMLLMAWGGKDTIELEHSQELFHEIARSKREIRALGVVHGDFRYPNVLWNEELGRPRSKLAPRLMEKRKSLKQSLCETQISETKDFMLRNSRLSVVNGHLTKTRSRVNPACIH
ncbi:uncharacterized protein V1513DRAFT_423498 [Lipomyces chichibuensis]|uniref:uncharacterized protein n=1 Tax=Lipomyces chichibuensis TaxID=1546026 RepID=UPI0033437325